MHTKQVILFGDKLMSRSDEGKSTKRSRLDGDQEVGLIYASRTGNTGEDWTRQLAVTHSPLSMEHWSMED
ncbi:hypothetical protein ACE6H2_005234 [Prunus campanulata]